MKIIQATFMSLMLFAPALAQEFDMSWYTIDGGGGNSGGGAFELSGTIAQPDASEATGGNYRLAGGFWPGAVTAGDGCNGSEVISKAKCKTRKGAVKRLTVIVKKATPAQDYTAETDTGQQITSKAKKNGKAKFNFKGDNKPPCGANAVTVSTSGEQCLSEAFECGC